MKRGVVLTTLIILLAFASLAQAADVDFPFGTVKLKLSPSEDPFPGFGDYYTTIDRGMKSALWNPASLGKLKLSEAYFGLATAAGGYNVDRTAKITEPSGTFEVGAGSGGNSYMNYALFYRYPAQIDSGLATKEVEVKSNLNYSTDVSGNDFSAAQKVNDWLTIGFASYNPVEGDLDLAGNFPVTGRMAMNMYGKNMGQLQINNQGHLFYEFKFGGVTTTYESGPVWPGFLSQEATIPFINMSELRNDLNVQAPYVGTVAAHHDKFYAGLNVLPVSANAVIDNDVRTAVSAAAADQYLWTPNFDPNNQTDINNWVTDPNKYGTQAGYAGKLLDIPQGELVADTKYRGYYNGSTARLDLGMMYDVNDWCTVGLDLENLNGASLNMKGNGLASYLTYRDINTQEANNIFNPGDSSPWKIFSDSWVTTFEAGGQNLYLEPEKNYPLPKRVRFGFCLKRPFLIAIDYEANQNPIVIPGSTEADNLAISDLALLRIGLETQVFAFPWVLRGGTTLAFKPTVTTGDTKAQDSINKAFKYGVLPLKLDLGTTINFWSYLFDNSLGVSALPLLSILQVDTTNADLSKMAYYSFGLTKDAWQVHYLLQADPLASAAAYNQKPSPPTGSKQFELSDVKYLQTLAVTYRF
ncbi:MAG TPA: hypothetical protein VMT55_02025 [Candidatus Sulfotelmatobacter sp.]|nr:hypothetical protein [Candidatus Sulfotelmatobacter sp.]